MGKNRKKRTRTRTNCYECKGPADPGRASCLNCRATGKSSRSNRHNITLDRLASLANEQDGNCRICQKELGENYSIDHDHNCCPTDYKSCGECIRGLLCEHCNRMLGNAKDSPETLRRAAEYIESGTLFLW